MSSLRTIIVCQNETCQARGAKGVLHRLQEQYNNTFSEQYPQLRIQEGDCMGECEMGPIVRVNDSIVLRQVNEALVDQLLQDPESIIGDVMHVLEQDRDTFDRIIRGDLF